jgi:hypothetical protein
MSQSSSINAPLDSPDANLKQVWFKGSGSSQTVYKGQGVCYQIDYGTATDDEPSRYNRVELPDSTNHSHFAGVLAAGYTIPSGGRLVDIYVPGSVCYILALAGESATSGSTVLQVNYGNNYGKFTAESDTGKGCATALQTITGDSSDLLCLAVLQEGIQSDGVDNS